MKYMRALLRQPLFLPYPSTNLCRWKGYYILGLYSKSFYRILIIMPDACDEDVMYRPAKIRAYLINTYFIITAEGDKYRQQNFTYEAAFIADAVLIYLLQS